MFGSLHVFNLSSRCNIKMSRIVPGLQGFSKEGFGFQGLGLPLVQGFCSLGDRVVNHGLGFRGLGFKYLGFRDIGV